MRKSIIGHGHHPIRGLFASRTAFSVGTGLMSYGGDQVQMWQGATAYVDKILKGVTMGGDALGNSRKGAEASLALQCDPHSQTTPGLDALDHLAHLRHHASHFEGLVERCGAWCATLRCF